ncbi:MAG: hypothetical protein WCX65_11640 [bacterium]
MPDMDIEIKKCEICGEAVEEWGKACPLCGALIYHDLPNPQQSRAKPGKSFWAQVLELTAMLAFRLVLAAIAAGSTLAAIKVSSRPPLNSLFPATYFIAFGIGVLIYYAIREIVDLVRGALGISMRYSLVWRNAFFQDYSGSSMAVAIFIVSVFSIFVTIFTDAAVLSLIEHFFQ